MKTIAIHPGHNLYTGASAHDGTDEWCWNFSLANALEAELLRRGYKVVRLERDKSLGYTAAMKKLGRQMKVHQVDIALELHFNVAGPSAHGFEFLYWQGSRLSKMLARNLAGSFGKAFPALSPRTGWVRMTKGYKALWLRPWTVAQKLQRRGAEYCYHTPCPVAICEHVFASNVKEWDMMKDEFKRIAGADADGIDAYFQEAGRC